MVSKKAAGGQKQGGGGGFFSNLFGRKTKKDEPEQEESKDTESKCLIHLYRSSSIHHLTCVLSCVGPANKT